jgi:hypothetical protein
VPVATIRITCNIRPIGDRSVGTAPLPLIAAQQSWANDATRQQDKPTPTTPATEHRKAGTP